MKYNQIIKSLATFLILTALSFFGAVNSTFAESEGEHEEVHDEHADEDRVEITADIASNAGIKSKSASSGLIKRTMTLYGKTIADPNMVSHIRASYPGTITKIRANIGDRVKAGDILAEIESNESLKRYTLTSPLTGVITTRNGNSGELAQEQVLLTVANYEQIWIEFRVFPSQAQQISVGQSVTAFSDLRQSESVIKHLIPDGSGQPFMLARVPLDNANGKWTLGLLLEGKVVIKQTQFPLVIDNRALQSFQGQQVVFIQTGNSYEPRPLELGLSDGKFTEVIEGLNVGDQYVVENSYLIKADFEKSAVSDDD